MILDFIAEHPMFTLFCVIMFFLFLAVPSNNSPSDQGGY
jgi:hypothetical protein